MGLRCSISYQLAYSTKTRYYLYFFSLFFYFLPLPLILSPSPLSFVKKRIHPSIVASSYRDEYLTPLFTVSSSNIPRAERVPFRGINKQRAIFSFFCARTTFLQDINSGWKGD